MLLPLKKISLVSIVAASVFAASWGASAASSDAKINITSAIKDNTCVPDIAPGGLDVPMGIASLDDFSTIAGTVALKEDFVLKLKYCGTEVGDVSVAANGNADTQDATAFRNTGNATGAAFQLWGGSNYGSQLQANGTPVLLALNLNSVAKTAELPLEVKLIQTSTTRPTSGTVASTATLTLTYQ